MTSEDVTLLHPQEVVADNTALALNLYAQLTEGKK